MPSCKMEGQGAPIDSEFTVLQYHRPFDGLALVDSDDDQIKCDTLAQGSNQVVVRHFVVLQTSCQKTGQLTMIWTI